MTQQYFDKNGKEYTVGTRVYYSTIPEFGTISRFEDESIWAVWDASGTELHFHVNDRDFCVATNATKPPPSREIMVVLHTKHGEVVTSYPRTMLYDAVALLEQYVNDGKKVTMKTS